MYYIWHDNDFDFALWVYKNSKLKSEDVLLKPIPKTNSKTSIESKLTGPYDFGILPAIKLESPDIIIQKIDDNASKILLVTEFMTHTPQWQHPAQRFARIYSSAILNIPVALVPNEFKAKFEKKKGVYKLVGYSCSPSVYRLFHTTSQVVQSPALLFFWPNLDGFPINDTQHATAPFIDKSIKTWFDFFDSAVASDGKLPLTDKIVSQQLKLLDKVGNKPKVTDFDTIQGIEDTDKYIKDVKCSSVPARITKRKKSLIFAPTGLKCDSSPFRTDPYAGMLCAFDNLFCRDSSNNRILNLVLRAHDVSIKTFENMTASHDYADCPFMTGSKSSDKDHLDTCPFTMPKYRRIYGEVADMIVFDDGVYYSSRGSVA